MISINNKVDCCGCNACGDVCPKQAISFKTDIEGFWYPKVDNERCIDCHLCEKICPIIQIDGIKKNDFDKPLCYAVQNKNLESLFNSTSGSAFAAFAEKIYKQGGYVGGAVFNEDYSVKQIISSDKVDLERLRNTKYVQSNSEGFYLQVKTILDEGNLVLVCGLPCQMAALRSFLRKDYKNLIIVDLICLGINSPKILPAYLKYKEDKHSSKIVYYKAKNKEFGWRQLTTKIVFENGDVEYDKKDSNYFTYGFIGTHAFARPSCYECRFKGFPRISDITLGDFWGVEKYLSKEYDNDLGTSAVLINSKKGASFFEKAMSSFKVKEIPCEYVVKGNLALINSITPSVVNREQFYLDLSEKPFEEVAKKYIKVPSERPLTGKRKLYNIARFWVYTYRSSSFNLKTWWQNIYFNIFCKQVKSSITKGCFLNLFKHSIVSIDKTAVVEVKGVLRFGFKRIKGSKLESRLLVEKGSHLSVGEGVIYYGADIEVFPKASLNIGNGAAFNINSTIICGDNITIGENVSFGRDVTVRDNNGGHFMSRRVYKVNRPVTIGQHSWLCEQSMVMPGSKIGVGVIVGARSVVSGKLPNFTLASGSPAQVVDEEIYWKQ